MNIIETLHHLHTQPRALSRSFANIYCSLYWFVKSLVLALLDEGVNDIPTALAVSACGHCYWEGLVFFFFFIAAGLKIIASFLSPTEPSLDWKAWKIHTSLKVKMMRCQINMAAQPT